MALAAVVDVGRSRRAKVRRRERKRGHPSKKTNIWLPAEQIAFAEQLGADLSDGVRRAIDYAMDALAELGPLRREVDLRSFEEEITEGQALGRWAKEAIEARRRGKR